MRGQAPRGSLHRSWGRTLIAAARQRRLIAALAVAGAVAAGLAALSPPAAATVPVLTAAHDLAWGDPIAAADLAETRLPAAAVPDGALTDPAGAVGRLLASPVRRGEPITDLRLVGPALLDAADGSSAGVGTVAVPIRIADAAAAGLLRAGVSIDVLAAPVDAYGQRAAPESTADSTTAEVVADGVRVLAVPADAGAGAFADGALVVIAASPAQAARLALADASSRLSVALRDR